jgi:hypothetical protein
LKRATSKVNATLLLAVMLVASVGACYILRDQWLTAKQTDTPQSSSTPMTIPLASMMLAAQVAENDSNWAGYIIASDLQDPQPNVTGVSASWTIPTVMGSSQKDMFAAVWIGIGGYFDDTLIQVGTEQDSIGGQGEYSVWYELLPDFSITIDTIIVSPGDKINASIQLVNPNTETWSIYIEDVTTSQTFQNDFIYASSQLSAEWIVERPIAGRRLATLTDIGTVSFTNCQATIGGQNGTISSFPVVQSVMYDSVLNAAGINKLTAVSSLTADGSSFTVETSPSAIPEFSTWTVLPLIMGTVLFAVALRKIYHAQNKKQPKSASSEKEQFILLLLLQSWL